MRRQMRELEGRDPLGFQDSREPGDEIADLRDVRQHVVGGRKVGGMAFGRETLGGRAAEEIDDRIDAFRARRLGAFSGRLDAEARHATGPEMVEEDSRRSTRPRRPSSRGRARSARPSHRHSAWHERPRTPKKTKNRHSRGGRSLRPGRFPRPGPESSHRKSSRATGSAFRPRSRARLVRYSCLPKADGQGRSARASAVGRRIGRRRSRVRRCAGWIAVDLGQGRCPHVVTVAPAAIPRGGGLYRVTSDEPVAPAEDASGLSAVE